MGSFYSAGVVLAVGVDLTGFTDGEGVALTVGVIFGVGDAGGFGL